eukprot:8163471-Heterocapsa_arctica.AAC.1
MASWGSALFRCESDYGKRARRALTNQCPDHPDPCQNKFAKCSTALSTTTTTTTTTTALHSPQ